MAGQKGLRIALALVLAMSGLTGCAFDEGTLAVADRDLAAGATDGEEQPAGDERPSAAEQASPDNGESGRRSGTPATDEPQSDEPQSDEPRPDDEPDWTVPQKLDERPQAGAALYLAFDETGNNPRLLLEIGGERREVLWPESVQWASLHEADADHDGTAESVILYSQGGGTGVSEGRMAVFRRDFTEIVREDPLAALRDKMDMSMDHAKREIVLRAEGRSWRIPFPDEETDWWPEPYIGNATGFSVRDDRLYSAVGLQASIGWFVADLFLGYIWDGKRLVTTDPEVHVHRQTAVPYRYADERLGLSVRVPAGWFVDTGAFGDWSVAGEGFTVLVEGHPENVIWNDVKDRITVKVPQGTRPSDSQRRNGAAKDAREQVNVTMESGDKAVLHLVRIGKSVELTFWSEKAEAFGVLREAAFSRHRDAILGMLASLQALDEGATF